jgi:hypothetical protein
MSAPSNSLKRARIFQTVQQFHSNFLDFECGLDQNNGWLRIVFSKQSRMTNYLFNLTKEIYNVRMLFILTAIGAK